MAINIQSKCLLSRNFVRGYTSPLTIPCRHLHRTACNNSIFANEKPDDGSIVNQSWEIRHDTRRPRKRNQKAKKYTDSQISTSATAASSNNGTIITESLEKTLVAHRRSNRASIIRIVEVDMRRSPQAPAPSRPSKVKTAQKPHKVRTASSRPLKVPSEVEIGSQHIIQSEQPPVHAELLTQSPPRAEAITAAFSAHIRNPLQDLYTARPSEFPWLKHLMAERTFNDGLSQLDAEVRALGDYLAPTAVEEEQCQQIIAEVSRVLEGVVPHPPQLIGLRSVGLGTTSSAIALFLRLPDHAPRRGSRSSTRVSGHQRLLLRVERALRAHPSLCEILSRTSEETAAGQRNLLMTRHCATRLRVSFCARERMPSMLEYIKDYQAEYPSLRYLFPTIRVILQTQVMYGSEAGGITSEALLVLVVAFLKMSHGRFSRPDDLGLKLLAFLRMFGMEVDLKKTGVAADPPSLFDSATLKKACQEYANTAEMPAHLRGQLALVHSRNTARKRGNFAFAQRLCVQDPTNYMFDLGQSCLHTRYVQLTLRNAYEQLRMGLDEWPLPVHISPETSLLGSVLRMDRPFFKTENMRKALTARQELGRNFGSPKM
ncbi:uncharacterized protein BO97DRAFT_277627 [Aspergillus homomorphus CBS 101889]|uniref:PAP-associated domain-containing protein n=1 Tax=Aspergillus homomorphus (strain CBS 101889) TaxID=1450537 RepID=A0A395HJ26_ASPHC|nr:hypothetical protein BO97DRAFT_277627 [Aspergillus homomorphus CBS 101889]RAL06898.1 hypothetical protein BO97DRAFT_277627 [Aspergillus homomorphus CBS 101889]